jgi:hypothetical protein
VTNIGVVGGTSKSRCLSKGTRDVAAGVASGAVVAAVMVVAVVVAFVASLVTPIGEVGGVGTSKRVTIA